MAFHPQLCECFRNAVIQGVGIVVGVVHTVNFAYATDCHLSDFLVDVLRVSNICTRVLLYGVLGVILEACLVCFGCTGDELTYAGQVRHRINLDPEYPFLLYRSPSFICRLPSSESCDHKFSYTFSTCACKLWHRETLVCRRTMCGLLSSES